MIDKSTIASNRLVVNKNYVAGGNEPKSIPVRYLEENQTELYKKFPLNNRVQKTSFHKYLTKDRIFKKPHRLTDLCEYCEKLREIKPELSVELVKFGYNLPENGINIEDAKRVLENKRQELLLNNDNINQVFFYFSLLFYFKQKFWHAVI